MSATRLRLVEVDQVSDTPLSDSRIVDPETAADALRSILPTDREGFAVMMLDSQHRPIALHLVSIGALNHAMVHPREVFKAALLANAAAIIMAHNHPSGVAEASDDDLSITKRLTQAGDILGIAVLDHLVLTQHSVYSLRQHNKL